MEFIKKHLRFRAFDKLIALSAAILSIMAFLGVDKNIVGDYLSNILSYEMSVPAVAIFSLGIAAIFTFKLQYEKRKKRFNDKFHRNTEALAGFATALNLLPVNDSVCGLYIGIRRVGEVGSVKYFLQFLTITKVSENDFRFLLFDNYDGKEWFIEGACIKVQNSLILKGAIDCQRDAVHTLYLKCPTHANSEKLEGVISLTRLDVTSAMSTKLIFNKICNMPDIGVLPKDAFRSSKLGEADFKVARVYEESELLEVMPYIRFLGKTNNLIKMKEYIDSEPNDPYVVHS